MIRPIPIASTCSYGTYDFHTDPLPALSPGLPDREAAEQPSIQPAEVRFGAGNEFVILVDDSERTARDLGSDRISDLRALEPVSVRSASLSTIGPNRAG